MIRIRRGWVRGAGYVSFAGLAFLVSLYITFPAEALAMRLAHELQKSTAGVWRASFGSASVYHLSGLALQDVTLDHLVPGEEPQKLRFDELRARVRILPLLLLRRTFVAGVSLRDGEANAVVAPHEQSIDAQLNFDKIDLAQPPLLGTAIGLPVGGKLSGSVEGTWDVDLRKAVAEANFTLDHGTVGPGSVAGMTLPSIALGNVQLGAEVKEGRLRLTNFKQQGGNLALTAKGNIALRTPPMSSPIDACITARADPAFLSANPKIRTALQIAEVQVKKDPEGNLHVPLQGMLGGIRIGNALCR